MKPTPIKWREKDVRELARVVKNYNQKLKYVEKSLEYTSSQLDKLSTVKLKKEIKTRADYNRMVKSIKRFSRRGSEEVIKVGSEEITKYEKREASIKLRVINTKRAKELKQLKLTKEKGVTLEAKKRNLRPKKFVKPTSEKAWEKFVFSLEKQIKSTYDYQKKLDFRKNYIKSINKNFGNIKGKDILIRRVSEIDLDEFVKIATSDQKATIDYMYGLDALSKRWRGCNNIWKKGVELEEEKEEREKMEELAKKKKKKRKEKLKQLEKSKKKRKRK